MPWQHRKALEELLLAGSLCSNVCYNKGQSHESPTNTPEQRNDKQNMYTSAKQWDAARSTVKRLLNV